MNIAVLFGGSSVEHDISILSAIEAINNIPQEYQVFPIYIDRENGWSYSYEYANLQTFTRVGKKIKSKKNCAILPNSKVLYEIKNKKLIKICELDCAINICHGGIGEGGGLAALFERSGIAFAGSGMLPSGIGLNKHIFKNIISQMGFNTLEHWHVTSVREIDELSLDFPLIVKPVSLGSSIGISKAENVESLRFAVSTALHYDNGVIIEPLLKNFIEINCAAIRCDGEILVSECEQPITSGDYLSFADKYLAGEKFVGQQNAERTFPAKIKISLKDTIQKITAQLYEKLGFSGVVRVDYLIEGDRVYVNEVNTIPGSLAHYLFNIEYSKLLNYLIRSAMAETKNEKISAFSSSVLVGANDGIKIKK